MSTKIGISCLQIRPYWKVVSFRSSLLYVEASLNASFSNLVENIGFHCTHLQFNPFIYTSKEPPMADHLLQTTADAAGDSEDPRAQADRAQLTLGPGTQQEAATVAKSANSNPPWTAKSLIRLVSLLQPSNEASSIDRPILVLILFE